MKTAVFFCLMITLSACSSLPTSSSSTSARRAEMVPWENGTLLHADTGVHMGGFSGLYFESTSPTGDLIFWTNTDRGPNADSFEDAQTKMEMRPFLYPEYQPRLIRFSVNRTSKNMKVLEEVLLKFPGGRPLTGLPNVDAHGRRKSDEVPVNVKGEPIAMDLMGIDPEGMCFDSKGFIWLSEEYRPSILKFNRNGQLIRRYVPRGAYTPLEVQKIDRLYGEDLVMQVLPPALMRKKTNRGFEGITCLKNKIYAILQSPLPNEGTQVRMIEFDPEQEETTAELIYNIESSDSDKIGDLAISGEDFMVIEQNSKTGKSGIHKIYRAKREAGSNILKKELFTDLVAAGYADFDKVEGLAMLDEKTAVVINDNDYALVGTLDMKTGKAALNSDLKSILAIIPIEEPPSQEKPASKP